MPKMKQLALLLVFHQTMAQFFNTEKCVIDYRSLENMWDQKLVHDLENCSYNLYRPPPQNGSEPFKVYLKFLMRSFNFYSDIQEFSTFTYTYINWHDDRLKWDPNKYDGISTAPVMSSRIWIPGLQLINGVGDEYDMRYLYIPCEIESTGDVQCVAWIVYNTKCATDLSDWPYDAQYCKLEFGPVNELGLKIQLEVGAKAITMFGADYGIEWDIMDYQQEEDQTSEKQLIMTFRLERHADILSAILIFPSLIVTVLTLSSLLIDARRNVRLFIICFSSMCHFIFLSELAADIPKHSKNLPRLVMFYRGSLIMTVLSIVLSFVFNLICTREIACPRWVISFNDYVSEKFIKFLIWPRWETKSEDTNKFVKDWIGFANFWNTVWIIVSIIAYVSMYCVYVPHPIPMELDRSNMN